eukprot:11157950-Lingulodinium_polyedra.AAC.1
MQGAHRGARPPQQRRQRNAGNTPAPPKTMSASLKPKKDIGQQSRPELESKTDSEQKTKHT